jgi:FkbM family methyltransferase
VITKELSFRGHPYKIACTEREGYQHPSWFSFEDEAAVRDRVWHIEPGDVVLDIGAAYGSYTLTALACGARHVFAWSPQGPPGETSEADMLEESLDINDWRDRCSVMDSGCYSLAGWLNPDDQSFSITRGAGDIYVEPLDSSMLGHSAIGKSRIWMKLDVEGAEVEVFKGGVNFINRYRPRIVVENHNFKRATIEQEVRDLMKSMAYREVETVPYHSVSHSVYEPC